jgi:hypothetical protein
MNDETTLRGLSAIDHFVGRVVQCESEIEGDDRQKVATLLLNVAEIFRPLDENAKSREFTPRRRRQSPPKLTLVK